MAIPGIPQNFYSSQANGRVYLQWDLSAGATSYSVYRSTDGVTYSSLATPSTNYYSDTSVTNGTQYYYKVAAVNSSGTSPYTNPQNLVPSPTAELSLGELRTRAQQRADRLGSNFVTLPEWNFFINQAMFELYDLLVDTYEDMFTATPATFTSDGTTFLYPLPNGQTTFINGISGATGYVAPPFYKLQGVDLALNSSANGYVTIKKFNFSSRNKFVYPNTASTIYGVFNLQYRLMGNNIEFIPTPSAGQQIRLWYIPRLTQLLADNDMTTIGFSGWLQYVICRAAKYALDKEESDTTKLDQELLFLTKRIEASAMNRDAGQADTISDVRTPGNGWGTGDGWDGKGGWAFLAPMSLSHNVTDHLLANAMPFGKLGLGLVAFGVGLTYFSYLRTSNFRGGISLSGIRDFASRRIAALTAHVRHVFGMSTQKEVLRVDASGNIASMADLDTFGDGAHQLLVDKTVNSTSHAFVTARVVNSPVAFGILTSRPKPASGSLVNLTPIHSGIVTANYRGVK